MEYQSVCEDGDSCLSVWSDLLSVTGPSNPAFYIAQSYFDASCGVDNETTIQFCENVSSVFQDFRYNIESWVDCSSLNLHQTGRHGPGYRYLNSDGGFSYWNQDENGQHIGEYSPPHPGDAGNFSDATLCTRMSSDLYACCVHSGSGDEATAFLPAYKGQFMVRLDKERHRLYLDMHESIPTVMGESVIPSGNEVMRGRCVLGRPQSSDPCGTRRESMDIIDSDILDMDTESLYVQKLLAAIGQFCAGSVYRFAIAIEDIQSLTRLSDANGENGCLEISIRLNNTNMQINRFAKRCVVPFDGGTDEFKSTGDWTPGKVASQITKLQFIGSIHERDELFSELCAMAPTVEIKPFKAEIKHETAMPSRDVYVIAPSPWNGLLTGVDEAKKAFVTDLFVEDMVQIYTTASLYMLDALSARDSDRIGMSFSKEYCDVNSDLI